MADPVRTFTISTAGRSSNKGGDLEMWRKVEILLTESIVGAGRELRHYLPARHLLLVGANRDAEA